MGFREEFPNAVELADEVRSVFGNGVKLIKAVEGDQEYSTRTSASIEPMVAVCPYPVPNRKKKYVLFPGYAITLDKPDITNYISAPHLADLYGVDFFDCAVFIASVDYQKDQLIIESYREQGLIFLKTTDDGKYLLPDGISNGR